MILEAYYFNIGRVIYLYAMNMPGNEKCIILWFISMVEQEPNYSISPRIW